MAHQDTITRSEVAEEAPRAFDKNLVAALSHPLRIRILDVLHQKVASPREIAEELGAKVGDVSYHVTKLRTLGAIELVRTEPRRGTLKHFYRAATRNYIDDDAMRSMPPSVRREIYGVVLNDILTRVAKAAEHNGFDRPDAHVTSTPLDLDEAGHEAMTTLLVDTLEKAMAIQAEVLERRTVGDSTEDDSMRWELSMLYYLLPPGPRTSKVDGA